MNLSSFAISVLRYPPSSNNEDYPNHFVAGTSEVQMYLPHTCWHKGCVESSVEGKQVLYELYHLTPLLLLSHFADVFNFES